MIRTTSKMFIGSMSSPPVIREYSVVPLYRTPTLFCQVSATDGSVSASPSRPAASPSQAGHCRMVYRGGRFVRFVITEVEANMVRSVGLTLVYQGELGGGVLGAVRRKTVWRFLV